MFNIILNRMQSYMTKSLNKSMEESTQVQDKINTLNKHLDKFWDQYPKIWNIFWRRNLEIELNLCHKRLAIKEKNQSDSQKIENWNNFKDAVFTTALWTLMAKPFIETAWQLRDLLF